MTHLLADRPLLFEPGDRLPRDEFLARWEQMPELKKAELIDGVVYMPSPVSKRHGRFDTIVQMLLNNYAARTPGCEPLSNATWLMMESAPQPDACLYRIAEANTGPVEDLAAGSPELIVEVAASSRSYDLGPKLALYQRAEVQEYVTALVEEERIEWRVLEQGSYRLTPPDADGIFRSKVFPGLWLDSAAFWRKDRSRLLAVLDQGLNTRERGTA